MKVLAVAMMAVGILAADPAVSAEPANRLPRIGFLGMDSQMQAPRIAALQDGLRELGYVDGRNVIIEYRWAEGNFGRLPQLASELVALKPAVIVTAAPPAIRALRDATTTIPIVMAAGNEPVAMGFVVSLARPGGNITGIAFQDTEFSAKRIELLRRAVPHMTHLAVLWNGVEGMMPTQALHNVETVAKELGLQVLTIEVRNPEEFATGVARAKARGAQGLLQMASPFITKHRRVLIAALQAQAMPAMCELRDYVVDGCLMTYSANIDAMFRRSADYVVRIIKGTNPADLAIDQPREFEFVINLNTAKALNLTIPSSLRVQATEVILNQ
jgi:putative ABC transport system substrate-binding protein